MAHFTRRYDWWQALELAIESEGWKIVLLLRLTPLVPFNLLNYALGCTAVPPPLPPPGRTSTPAPPCAPGALSCIA